jgi:3'-phosphoadenosine 5'-phosphosulfate sulfotransferase (PAPS reductase)/FAD synthetase
MKNKNLLVSFSGGETSAFMSQWIKNNLEYKIYDTVKYVFANTGLENEETLEFVEQVDEYFKLGVEWIEERMTEEQYRKFEDSL